MVKNKEKFVVLILFFIVIGITFYELLSGNKVLVSGDNLSPIAIKKAISNSSLNYNTYPLWSPWLLSGMPTIHSLLNISDNYYLHKLYVSIIDFFDLAWIWNFLLHMHRKIHQIIRSLPMLYQGQRPDDIYFHWVY